MQIGVEKDDGVAEDEYGVGGAEAGHEHLVAGDVALGEHLHQFLDFLGLTCKKIRISFITCHQMRIHDPFSSSGRVTEYFTVLEPLNPVVDELYAVLNHESTD